MEIPDWQNYNIQLQNLLNRWDAERPRYMLVEDAAKMLRSFYTKGARSSQINDALDKIESIGAVSIEMSYYIFRAAETIPQESYWSYLRLVDRAFAEDACSRHNAESAYHTLVGLIEESEKKGEKEERTQFFKNVLKRIDKEVCTTMSNPLPPDHPYLK